MTKLRQTTFVGRDKSVTNERSAIAFSPTAACAFALGLLTTTVPPPPKDTHQKINQDHAPSPQLGQPQARGLTLLFVRD